MSKASKKDQDETPKVEAEIEVPVGVHIPIGIKTEPPKPTATQRAAKAIEVEGPRNRGKKLKTGDVFLPQNTSFNAAALEGFRYEQANDHDVWSHPEQLLKEPTVGGHYCWADTEAITTGTRIASGRYRPILKKELRQDPIVAGKTHKGVDDYVHRHRTILCEIPEAAYVELYIAPAVGSVDRLARRQEQFQGEVESISQGKAVGKLTVSKNGTE